jgi:leader peptidase (prepilin peptidase) / N-methyltransferase
MRAASPAAAQPIVLAAGAGLAALCLFHFGVDGEALIAAFVVSVLVVISAVDIERRILPNRILVPATAVVLAAQITLAPERAPEWILAALGAAVLLLLPLLVRPGGVGMGDVKLAFFLGAALGTAVFAALLLGLLAVLPFSLFLMLCRRHPVGKTAIPLGPFLTFGAIVTIFLSGGPSAG